MHKHNYISLCVLLVLILILNFSNSSAKKEDIANHKNHFAKKDTESTQTSYTRRTRNNAEKEARIVGGKDADLSQYPFFVESGAGYGGTLIHDDIVLSAAHCALALDFDYDVLVNGTIAREIDGFSVHPFYNDNTQEYDYMIMILNEGIPPSVIEPVRLNNHSEAPSSNQKLTVIGYGVTSDNGGWGESNYSGSDTLQEVNINFVPHGICNAAYEGEVDQQTMFCAGSVGKDTCQGDSGGPILDANQKNLQYGITSWGTGCGQDGYPGVYSRVSYVYDWIQEQICYNSRSPPKHCSAIIAASSRLVLNISIFYDDYPYETGWDLIDRATGETLIFVPPGSNYEPGLKLRSINVLPGNYTFELLDWAGDGICCDYGDGEVTLSTFKPDDISTTTKENGDHVLGVLREDGRFSYTKRVHFEITASGDIIRSDDGTGNMDFSFTNNNDDNNNGHQQGALHTIRIDVMYDEFPNEVSWMLINTDNQQIVYMVEYNSVLDAGLESYRIEKLPSGNYWFLMLDYGYDGICCDYGSGWYTINEVIGDYEIIIDEHPGTFIGRAEKFFTLLQLYNPNS